jgi:hypothetical protein
VRGELAEIAPPHFRSPFPGREAFMLLLSQVAFLRNETPASCAVRFSVIDAWAATRIVECACATIWRAGPNLSRVN